MGPRAGLDWCGKSRLTGIRSPDITTSDACDILIIKIKKSAISIATTGMTWARVAQSV